MLRVAGINFDHMHMGDLLRQVARAPERRDRRHLRQEPARMQSAIAEFRDPARSRLHRLRACLAPTKPDLVDPLPRDRASTPSGRARRAIRRAHHRREALRRLARRGRPDDRRDAKTGKTAGDQLAAALVSVARHRQAADRRRRRSASVIEVHYYDGNRGPLYHLADKVEVTAEEVAAPEADELVLPARRRRRHRCSITSATARRSAPGSWTAQAPIEVTCVVDEPPGLEVDEHAITVARYAHGLSQDRDPLGHLHRPVDPPAAAQVRLRHRRQRRHDRQLRLRGSRTVQTRARPEATPVKAEPLPEGERNGIEYVLGRIAAGRPVEGPLDPALA